MIAYEVKVLNCFKGHLENRVVTINTGSFCGYTFDVGGRYMIYANRLTKTGNYSVSGCSRTTGAVDYERSNIERFLSNAQEKESMRYFFGNESIFKHTFFAVEKSMREEFRKAMRD